ncbi:uncharacterized protein [Gossypium hirsutum]|uniref:Uncharacterized protein n=1 Tax=Gossypium hirsutum TaxID=3635 RepID=A0A1U8HV12_GOSHI|nr:uncharacterized protein LOC107889794 [Gossypium hirsutum]
MKMVDAASGGALVNMTLQRARKLISTMAENFQQYRPNSEPTRQVNGKDHPNLNYGANPRYNPPYQPRPLQPPPQHKPSTSLEAIVERLAADAAKYQQRTDASIQELTNQVSKLSMAVNRLESQGKLPSQTEPNPRQNVSTITLRNGKVLETVPAKNHGQENKRKKQISDPTARPELEVQKPVVMPPPFPGRLARDKKEKEEKEILKTFRNVEVNIPLLDAIKQIPHFAKFLKELCTSKMRLIGNERVNVGENVSAVLQKKVPPKYKDQETGVIIQLAVRTVVYPEGLLEDVLVKVNELVFPANFYIIDMEDDNSANSSDIILGRPFLSTARTRIDVWSGTFTMEFDNEMVKFNVYEDMGHLNDKSQIVSCRNVDLDVKQEKLSMIQKPIREVVMKASKLEIKPFLEHTRILIEENVKINEEDQMIGESEKCFKDSGKRSKPFCKNIQVHKMGKLILNKPKG